MAEDKDKDKEGNELLGQDFLGDMQKDVSSMPTTGLFDKLAKLGAQQRLQPAVNVQSFQNAIQPTFKLIEDAEDRIATAMTAYTLANPDIDDSKLFDATGDLVTGTMTDNNAKFKELNRKLGYMSPRHPDYAKTVQEITKIQETSVNLRNDNAKLLGIRNAIKELDVQEMSKGQTPGQQAMYNDILVGNKENFQAIDGKLHWVNPSLENGDPNKSISVESINAAGPTMADDAAFESHYDLMTAVKGTKAEDLSDQDLNYQVNTMFKSIGNDGLKSLIFDSGNADTEDGNPVAYSKNGMMFNTNLWWTNLYSDLGVDANSEKALQIRNDIQQNGVMHNIEVGEGDNKKTIRVKEHFRKWYSNSLKQVEKTGDGKPKAKTNLNQTPGEEPELKPEPLGGSAGGNADFKNDAYLLESENSMMSFDSAWNSGKESKVLEEINTLLPGLKINNIVEDADLLSARKLTFDTSNSYFDNWNGNYAKELGLNGSYGGFFGVSSISNQGPIENSRGLSDQEAFAEVLRVYQAASSTAPSWIDSSEWRGLSAAEKFDLVARKAMTNDGNWKDYSNWQ